MLYIFDKAWIDPIKGVFFGHNNGKNQKYHVPGPHIDMTGSGQIEAGGQCTCVSNCQSYDNMSVQRCDFYCHYIQVFHCSRSTCACLWPRTTINCEQTFYEFKNVVTLGHYLLNSVAFGHNKLWYLRSSNSLSNFRRF